MHVGAYYNTYSYSATVWAGLMSDHPQYIHQSYASGGKWKNVGTDDMFIPEGRIVYAFHGRNSSDMIIDRGDSLLGLDLTQTACEVRILAATPRLEEAKKLVEDNTELIIPSPTQARANFWFLGDGPQSYRRSLNITPWKSIRRNYNPQVQTALDELTSLKEPPSAAAGRLILFHGPPGSGKTNLIKALTSEWHKWASIEVVLDPERFLGSAGYLLAVVADSGNNPLVILEDSGELMTKDSKRQNGQSVSRLLNMADGLATQFSNAMFLITTNEPIGELNEALTRKGRCLAVVEVGRLSADQSSEWLGRPVSEPMVLSDLYAEQTAQMFVKNKEEKTPAGNTGLYL